jgi:hypothetical protein
MSSRGKIIGQGIVAGAKDSGQRRKATGRKRSHRIGSYSAVEDSDNLSKLEVLAAEGTMKAYKRAVAVLSEIVQVKDGYLVKVTGATESRISSKLKYRVETKGNVYVLNAEPKK